MKRLILMLGGVLLCLAAGCATSHNVHVAPIQVAPIRMTMDVNVNVHESESPVEGGDANASADDDAQDGVDGGAHARTLRPERGGSNGG